MHRDRAGFEIDVVSAQGQDLASPQAAPCGQDYGGPVRPRDSVDQLDDLLGASDLVVVAAPLTDETAGMIGADQLRAMRENAWLINIARGRLLDELALRRALEATWIAGAVLDVFTDEPLPPDSPLYDTPNLILTPHTSWSSDQVVERSVHLFVENLRRFAGGQPLENVVDLEAGY